MHIPKHIALNNDGYKTSHSIKDAITTLDQLAKILRVERMTNGAISFDKVEVKFNLTALKEPAGVT